MKRPFLGIDTSCDDTSVAIYWLHSKQYRELRKSQAVHAPYKGVVPELASRDHLYTLPLLVKEILDETKTIPKEIEGIGITNRPGLLGSLLVGLSYAKALAYTWKKPFLGINHIEGHLFSAFLQNFSPKYPFLGVILSGGHSEIIFVKGLGNYKLIGSTVDDAAGEALDKIASYIGLGYPGGPAIEKAAKHGDLKRFSFPIANVKRKPLHFSFSGVKTAALSIIQKEAVSNKQFKNDLAACFQYAVFKQIEDRIRKAIKELSCKRLVFGGGVVANNNLRHIIQTRFGKELEIYFPKPELCTDNAAMIAQLAAWKMSRGEQSDLSLSAKSLAGIC